MTKKATILLFLLSVALSLSAQESRTAYNFLRLPVSAHGAALGGDNITLVEDDASLIFSNPALLRSVNSKTIGLNYMNYMKGANTGSATYNWDIKKVSIGVSGQFLDYGKMKETTVDGTITGEFSAKDISIAAYIAYDLSERIAGGISAKFITSYLGDYNSLAMCVDLGLNYYDPEREWSISAVAKNLGGQLKAYNDEYDRLPFDLMLGVSKKLTGAPFRLSATLSDLTHWDYRFVNHLSAGVDVLLSQNIWLGAGYNFRRADEMGVSDGENVSNHGAGITLGGGIELERFKLNIAYGKYHVSSSSILVNAAFTL